MSISTASRVVILGGTSGIGLAIAKAAAAAGASVVVAAATGARPLEVPKGTGSPGGLWRW